MSTLHQRIAEFVGVTPVTKSYSKATVENYRQWLRNFAAWIGPDATLADFCEDKLRAYRNATLAERHYCRTTLCSMYAAFHAFAAWLKSEGVIERDPADVLGRVKPSKPKRDNLISSEEAFAMLDACDRYADANREILARGVLCLCVHGGLRRGDLLQLELGDVYLAAGYVHCRHAKGDKERKVYLCKEALDALTVYIDKRPDNKASNRLLVLTKTQNVALPTLNAIIRETWAMAGLNKSRRVTIHSFRHNYITRLLNNGADLSSVSKLAGHANAAITSAIYHNPEESHLRAVAELSARPVPPTPPTPPPGQASDPPPLRWSTCDESA